MVKKWYIFGVWGYGSSYFILWMDGDSLIIGYWEL